MLQRRTFDVESVLRPARRTLGLYGCVRLAVRGLLVAAFPAALCALLAAAFGIGALRPVVPALLLLGALAGAFLGWVRRPDNEATARAVDTHFGLGDRLTTALEFRSAQDIFATMQRSDTARSVRGLPVRRAARGLPGPRDLGATAVSLAVIAALLAYQRSAPGPRTALASAAPSLQHVRIQGLVGVAALQRLAGADVHSTKPGDPAQIRTQRALLQLQRRLARAQSLGQVLRAVSVSQDAVQRLDAQLRPLNPSAVAQLNRSLNAAHLATPSGASSLAGSRSLTKLAASLRRLSAARQAAVAHALAKASRGQADPRLRSSLQEASHALTRRNSHAAAVYLKHAAALLAQNPSAARSRAQLRKTEAGLEKLKNRLANVHRAPQLVPTPQIPKTARTGAGHTSGSGTKPGAHKREKTRHGSFTWKTTSERNAPRTAGAILNTRRSGEGGRHLDPLGTRTRKHSAARASLIIHGHEQQGTRLLENGPKGAAAQASRAQYHQILVRYAQTARGALDRAALPPGVRSYVRQYFTLIAR